MPTDSPTSREYSTANSRKDGEREQEKAWDSGRALAEIAIFGLQWKSTPSEQQWQWQSVCDNEPMRILVQRLKLRLIQCP